MSTQRRKLVKANDAVTRKYSKHMKEKESEVSEQEKSE